MKNERSFGVREFIVHPLIGGYMRNFLSVEQFNNDEVLTLVNRALDFKYERDTFVSDASIVNMFFENSTRTKMSFEMAQVKIGMQRFNFDTETSSLSKGESLYDSLLTMQAIGVDIAVIRHTDKNYINKLLDLKIQIVNAGSGNGQHPSQSLLDIMTIFEEFNGFENVKVAIIGDLVHSRVAKSNMMLLKQLGASVLFAGPSAYYDKEFDKYGEYKSIDEVVAEADVVMMLRVQLERHGESEPEYTNEEYLSMYGLTLERKKMMKDSAIIMHPAPVNRGTEIASELVEDKQSRIVTQMSNGVYMRMAILEWVLEGRRQWD